MDDPTQSFECNCGMPERWVANSGIPVEFDELTNEYHLIGDNRQTIMRYCFWCGGSLPKSTRGELFTTPSDEEKGKVRRLLSGVTTAREALQVLGPPDDTFEWKEGVSGGGYEDARRWRKQHRYSTRWTTLDLVVHEMPDGTIEYSLSGKYVGPPLAELTETRRPWWQFWKKR